MSEERPRRKLPVRWLTLAETVGVLALIVAALGWWDNHRERAAQDQERAAAAREKAVEASRETKKAAFLLVGQVGDDGERIRLASARADQVIQTQTLIFPSEIRGDTVETTGNPRIDRGWIEGGLKKAHHEAGAVRVPVGIVTTFVEDGEMKTDRSVYVVGAVIKERMLRGASVKLEGLSLARRGVTGDLRMAVDQAWSR